METPLPPGLSLALVQLLATQPLQPAKLFTNGYNISRGLKIR